MPKVTAEEIEKRFRTLRERIGKYRPDQARDDNGRFAAEGGGTPSYSGYMTGAYESHEAMATVMHQHGDRVSFLQAHAKQVKSWAFSPTTRKLLYHTALAGSVSAGIEIPLHLAVEHVASGLAEALGVAGVIGSSYVGQFIHHLAKSIGLDFEKVKDWAISTVVNMIGLHEKFAEHIASHIVTAKRYHVVGEARGFTKLASTNTIANVALRELLYQLQRAKEPAAA